MAWVLTLTIEQATLYCAQENSVDWLVTWPVEAIVNQRVSIADQLRASCSAEHGPNDQIVVLVDQPGDVLKSTPETLNGRRLTRPCWKVCNCSYWDLVA